MTKQEIKDLCEDDKQLQWWAMVLFAEIAASVAESPEDLDIIGRTARLKAQEFPSLIVQRQLEKIKERQESLKSERESIK